MAVPRNYDHISADGNARQQVGDSHNTTTNNYYAPQNPKQSLSLLHAAQDGNLERIRFLVEQRGVDVETEDEDGLTALHCAAWSGSAECAEYLLEKGAYVHHRSEVYGSPLTLAAFQKHYPLLITSFRHDRIKAKESAFLGGLLGSPLHALAFPKGLSLDNKTVDAMVNTLIDAGAPVNATQSFDLACADAFARNSFPPPQASATCGTNCESHGYRDEERAKMCEDLLRYDHSTLWWKDSDGCNALMYAASSGAAKVVQTICEKHMPVAETSTWDQVPVKIRYLNSTNAAGQTALMIAAVRSQPSCLNILLMHGAHIEIRDNALKTALEHVRQNAGSEYRSLSSFPNTKQCVDLLEEHARIRSQQDLNNLEPTGVPSTPYGQLKTISNSS